MSAPGPRPTSRMPMPWRRSKKLSRPRGGSPGEACARHCARGVVPGRDAGRPEKQTHLSLGQERLTPLRDSRSTYPVDLSVRCGLPRTRGRRRSRAAGLQQRSHAAPSRRNRDQGHPGAHAIVLLDQAGWHGAKILKVPSNIRSSNPSTISSITAATPGTGSSISPGRSCPSHAATGPAWVT